MAIPAAWGDGSIGVGYLVRVDGGQDVSFQVPDVDAGVRGGTHDELPWGGSTLQPHCSLGDINVHESMVENLLSRGR